jgi:ribonuclease III
MDRIDFSKAEKKIGVQFNDKGLLVKAFTHRSFLNENKGIDMEHNERLEFLGDAVLELAVTSFLYEKYPKRNEGELTSFRASLVNTNTLSNTAVSLGFNEFLLLSKGEAKDTGRARQYILANSFEAVVGAVYLDLGYQAAYSFIAKNIFPLIDEIVSDGTWIDSKSMFQEKAQEKFGVTPVYETIKEEGPDHDKIFTVAVMINKKIEAKGKGSSKQDAEQIAAHEALKKNKWLPN